MSAKQSQLDKESLALLLDAMEALEQPELDSASESLWTYRTRAALRIVYEVDELQPPGASAPTAETAAYQQTLNESTVVYTPENHPVWQLNTPIRRETLLHLGSQAALQEALALNPARQRGALQALFEQLIRGEPLTNEQMTSLETLENTRELISWLAGIVPNLPDPGDLRRRIAREQLIKPFRFLAGKNFYGRKKELARLRAYVGVLGEAEPDLTPPPEPNAPMLIYGPGGMGKSTLISRFLLEHAEVDETRRFPYVYIDFNRRDLDLRDPVSILLECARQLGVQFPLDETRWSRLALEWKESRRYISFESNYAQQSYIKQTESVGREWQRFVYEFLNALSTFPQGLPFLIILDTFEELQYHRREYIGQLWDFLSTLQNSKSALQMRVVISGRSTLPAQYPLPQGNRILLKGLDTQSARDYLMARGLPNADLADQVIDVVGSSPLCLRLAADLINRPGFEISTLVDEDKNKEFFDEVKENLIQGLLYRRILEYIHDQRVRELAHPGLVLRRITPELILEVLAPAVKIEVKDPADARHLFDLLSREVSLVEPDQPRALELRQRPDLRSAMLELLKIDKEKQVNKIHARALAYFSEQRQSLEAQIAEVDTSDPLFKDLQERLLVVHADEIYHRLALNEDPIFLDAVNSAELQKIADELGQQIEDLPKPALVYLKPRVELDAELDQSLFASADLHTWEIRTARVVRNLLGLRQYEEALVALKEREERTPDSPLYLLHATALKGLRRSDEARKVLYEGIRRASPYSEEMLQMRLLFSYLSEENGEFNDAIEEREQALEIAQRSHKNTLVVQILLDIYRLLPQVNAPEEQTGAVQQSLLAALQETSDDELRTAKNTLRDAVTYLAFNDPALVQRAIRLLGLSGPRPAEMSSLASSLTSWDEWRSSELERKPGHMARLIKAKPQDDLLATWREYLEKTDWETVQRRLQPLLSKEPLTPTLALALADLFRNRLLLSQEQATGFQQALAEAFSTAELETLVHSALNISMSEVSTRETRAGQIADLVNWAETTGRLVDLLLAAYYDRPDNPRIRQLFTDLEINLPADAGLSDPNQALAYYQQMLAESEAANDWEGLLTALNGLGDAHIALGDMPAAETAIQRWLEVENNQGDPLYRAGALERLGQVLTNQGRYDEAQSAYDKQLAVAQSLDMPDQIVFALGNMGSLNYTRGTYDKALEIFAEAITITRRAGDRQLEMNYLEWQGQTYYAAGNIDLSVQVYMEVLQITRELGDRQAEANALHNLGFLYNVQGDFNSARDAYQQALEIRIKELGEDHAATADTLNNLGLVLRSIGDYAAARPYMEKALIAYRAAYGEQHPSTATALNNLGLLLYDMGDLYAAKTYYEQALVIYRNTVGEENPNVAQCLNNLGLLLRGIGDLEGAKANLEHGLEIYRQTLGENNIDTASSLNNLGYLLQDLGDFTGAKTYYEQALAIRRSLLGEADTATADSLNNLGLLLRATGDLQGAKPYLEQSLEIYRRVLGDNHPNTATGYNNLGLLLYDMGDYQAAKPYYEQALTTYRKILGDQHPNVATGLNNLGLLLQSMGDLDGARDAYEESLALTRAVLGEEHTATAQSLNNLGLLLRAMGDLEGAKPYLEQSLGIYRRALGENHPDTARSLNNLGTLLQDMGNLQEAKAYLQKGLEIRQATLGDNHPDTAQSLNNMGFLLYAMGDTAAAEPFIADAVAILERTLPPNHPTTLQFRENLDALKKALQDDQVKLVINQQVGEVAEGGTIVGVQIQEVSGKRSKQKAPSRAETSPSTANVEAYIPMVALGELSGRGKRSHSTFTAFLVADALVMTSFTAVADLLEGITPPQNLAFRFDLLASTANQRLTQGRVHTLRLSYPAPAESGSPGPTENPPWLYAANQELNYAILNLALPAGFDILGSPGGQDSNIHLPRYWLDLADNFTFSPEMGLMVIQAQAAGAIAARFVEKSGVQSLPMKHWLLHSLDITPSGMGAPLLNTRGQVVAMHIGTPGINLPLIPEKIQQKMGVALTIPDVVGDLRARNLWPLPGVERMAHR